MLPSHHLSSGLKAINYLAIADRLVKMSNVNVDDLTSH